MHGTIINPKNMGWELFSLRDYQESEVKLFEEACRREAVREVRLKARQVGFTTLEVAGAFHNVFFNDNHPWLIASQTEDDAKATLTNRVKTPYKKLRLWMQARGPTITDNNSEKMTFDNGSYLESIPATSGAGRSSSVFGVLTDEFAFVENGADLYAALDPLCYGPMFVFSTANGMGNAFHSQWLEAQKSDSAWNSLSRETRADEPVTSGRSSRGTQCQAEMRSGTSGPSSSIAARNTSSFKSSPPPPRKHSQNRGAPQCLSSSFGNRWKTGESLRPLGDSTLNSWTSLIEMRPTRLFQTKKRCPMRSTCGSHPLWNAMPALARC